MSLQPEKILNVGLIGCGNIGTGVAEWLEESGSRFDLHLSRVAVRDPSKPRGDKLSHIGHRLTNDALNIVHDPKIDILCELMGGVEPARTFTLDAIDSGKSVVNANKALLARHMKEIFDAARSKQVNIGFEGSVGGAIPIMGGILRLQGEKIMRMKAIINGTTNFILTQMEEGVDFDTALKQAQCAGFAEQDHTLDTGGFDSQSKLAVLADLAFNTQTDVDRILCHGILDIIPVDIDFARRHNYVIKLLAMADRIDDTVDLRVTPALLKNEHPLAGARYEFNKVYINSSLAGPLTFDGRGAGKEPTTSAVVSDLLQVADNIRKGKPGKLPTLDSEIELCDPNQIITGWYLRTHVRDIPGSASSVLEVIANHGLNTDHIEQTGDGPLVPIKITLDPAPYGVAKSALQQIAGLEKVQGTPLLLPIFD